VRHLLGEQERIDRHEHAAGLGHPEDRQDLGDRGIQVDPHAVPPLEAGPPEPLGEARGATRHLGIGEPVAAVNQRLLLRRAERAPPQHVVYEEIHACPPLASTHASRSICRIHQFDGCPKTWAISVPERTWTTTRGPESRYRKPARPSTPNTPW